MNAQQLAAVAIQHLSWPLLAGVALLIYRRPISELLGRIKSYEGVAGTLTFGDQLASAERSVDQVVEAMQADEDALKAWSTEESPLAAVPMAHPAAMILAAWDIFAASMGNLAKPVLGEGHPLVVRPRSNPTQLMTVLAQQGVIGPSFLKPVFELRDLRNRVAHGEHNPTEGEAVTYVESIREMALAASILAEIETKRRREQEV